MNKGKSFFVLSSCDEWKSWQSMRLIGVASSPRQLKKLIRAYKEIEYPENLNEIPSEEINKHLTYGYVETVTLNTLL